MKDLVKSVLKVFDGKQKRKLVGMMFLILINSGVSLAWCFCVIPVYHSGNESEQLLKMISYVLFMMDFICRIQIS